jgi:thiol:disulfide interchange protein DsbC
LRSHAGSQLFYVDKTARYLLIGRVYDMQTRQDLTAVRLLEVNPDLLVGGAAGSKQEARKSRPPAAASARRRRAVPPG